MHDATLCYIFQEDKILLGIKKNGFGAGVLNGFGGKVNQLESLTDAAVRETKEESNVTVSNLTKVAELEFRFPNAPKGKNWDQTVHVYFATQWTGEPKETDEMIPEWFLQKPFLDGNNVIYQRCWDADKYWFPEVLKGKKIKGAFIFKDDNKTVYVPEFTYIEQF